MTVLGVLPWRIPVCGLLEKENVIHSLNTMQQLVFPPSDPPNASFLVDCSFSRGPCVWQQDTSDDFDWNPADHDNGELTVAGIKRALSTDLKDSYSRGGEY